MTHSRSEQIKAIQEARHIITHYGVTISPDLDSKLNDAGSTIAALNISGDRLVKLEDNLKKIKELIDDEFQSRDEIVPASIVEVYEIIESSIQ